MAQSVDDRNARQRAHYHENRERLKLKMLEYYKNHKPERKKYYKKNSKKYAKYARAWRERHPGRVTEINKIFKQKRMKEWLNFFRKNFLDKCSICGYNRNFAAIDFHHRNPEEKEFAIGRLLSGPINERAIREIGKCIPLCANCHRELHNCREKS